jgi:hypothetical protein
MTEQIYMRLLDEGVDVWRPVPAWKVNEGTYIVLRPEWYDPDDEHWEFPPGSTVICEPKTITDGDLLAAVAQKQPERQTA